MKFLRYLIENFWDFDPSDLAASEETSNDMDKMSSAKISSIVRGLRNQIPRLVDMENEIVALIVRLKSNPYGNSKNDERLQAARLQLDKIRKKLNRTTEQISTLGEELRRRRMIKGSKQATDIIAAKQQDIQTSSNNIPNPTKLVFNPTPPTPSDFLYKLQQSRYGQALRIPFKIVNPYYTAKNAGAEHYVGHPANFQDWTSKKLATTYIKLDEILKRNGKPLLSIMYAGREYGMTFVAVANDNFVWRRNFPSMGGVGEWLYINGIKVSLSSFLYRKDLEQDQMVAAV